VLIKSPHRENTSRYIASDYNFTSAVINDCNFYAVASTSSIYENYFNTIAYANAYGVLP
jgi:hypothetical protein